MLTSDGAVARVVKWLSSNKTPKEQVILGSTCGNTGPREPMGVALTAVYARAIRELLYGQTWI